MNWVEAIKIGLQTLSLVFVGVSIIYAGRQLKLVKQTHADNHEWNRRMAAQDAASMFNQRVSEEQRDLLEKEFKYLSGSTQVLLEVIKEKFNENKDCKSAVHSLLNYFEFLARGINQGIYDERVIKAAWRGAMIRAFDRFELYIEDRQKTSPMAWKELESRANRWRSEDSLIHERDAIAANHLTHQ